MPKPKYKKEIWWGGEFNSNLYELIEDKTDKQVKFQSWDRDKNEPVVIEEFLMESTQSKLIYAFPPKKIPFMLPNQIDKDEIIEPVMLHEEVLAFIMKYLELPDEVPYELLSLWVMLSWMPREMHTFFPYLHFIGPKESGKTRALEVLVSLARRGYTAVSPTEAVIAREIERKHVVLFLDELEYSEIKERWLKDLLNAGYKKGTVYPRCTQQGEGPIEYFDVSGFKAFSSRAGYDDILESRCLTIPMKRCITDKPFIIDYKEAQIIRTKLLKWLFIQTYNHYKYNDVSDTNNQMTTDANLYSKKIPSHQDANYTAYTAYTANKEIYNNTSIRYRLKELSIPFHMVNAVIDVYAVQKSLESIGVWFEMMSSERKLADETSLEADVVIAYNNLVTELDIDCQLTTVSIQDICKKLSDTHNGQEYSSNYIGRIIKALGFKLKRTGTKRGYVIASQRFEYLKKRYVEEENKIIN